LALELGSREIRVNCVNPGPTDTELLRQHFVKNNIFNQEAYEKFANSLLFKRLVHPEDVAETVAFLCSNNASMITGQIIAVDGGRSLRW